jgi:predicted SprT family Zn-dependent metalloprotease
MPKLEKISGNEYKYLCECGCIIIYETDIKPDRAIKCFKCQNKIDKDTKL